MNDSKHSSAINDLLEVERTTHTILENMYNEGELTIEEFIDEANISGQITAQIIMAIRQEEANEER